MLSRIVYLLIEIVMCIIKNIHVKYMNIWHKYQYDYDYEIHLFNPNLYIYNV